MSFQRGHEGNVSFVSKSQLIRHYEETLGAVHVGGRLVVIETPAALKLIDKYFKIFSMKRKKDLNVDFIGGEGTLTKEEEKIISDFLKSRQTEKKRAVSRKKASKRKLAA